MARDQVSYRLVLDAGEVQTASEPAPLGEILAAFKAHVATGVFRPGSRRRLLVVSDQDWACRRSFLAQAGNHEAA